MARRNSKTQAGRLRIVAGNWRSRLLDIADVPGLRPTSARIRETLFNWLTPKVVGARCLDLCAGTGALGIEALSRGAMTVEFVESSAVAAATLRENLNVLDAAGAVVHEVDARRFPGTAKPAPFDIVFLDPPFAADLMDELCRLLEEQALLADDARIYLEMDRQQKKPRLPANWQCLKAKTAGNVRYWLATNGD